MASDAAVAIVEDDGSVRAALISLVGALGFTACGFADAESFLADTRAGRVGCLVADVRLPGLSGLALHHVLRASGIAVPTILITAYPDEASRGVALRAGAFGYLVKPVQPEALLACIRAALGS
ncbi:response regulator [Rhodoplanes sp. TEM]|uniref:Response regulator n=1 Tax=Rhodoplanes tepidamans TaxID=200616 RepID=A0ABT5JJQ8_RHOTP|nr:MULTISPECIES: response regulator [Rhodoplanes]MDC7789772.1 response regulator [Rhodoplanes tepidamans]MDC7984882.1 response regulator [Rhodoplanes sp. TEM]MDQ0357010.1 FixJ family two-component response regulator [Rhodoplanes tepidamans]